MASQVGIANLALGHIGEPPITNFDEGTVAATTVSVFFGQTVDETLRDHPWNFAVKRQQLARLGSAPAFGWLYQYQLPSDFLRSLQVNENKTPHQIEGRVIVTDNTLCQLRYISRVEDTTIFDPMFVSALAARLAYNISMPITQSEAIKAQMWQLYLQKISMARDVDAQEEPARSTDFDRLEEARFGYSSAEGSFRGIS